MNTKKNEYIYEGLRKNFMALGRRIANKPTNFITIPIFITIICLTGFQKLDLVTDLDIIFTSPDSEATLNRRYIENVYPLNTSSNFSPHRRTTKGRFGETIITAKDKGSILRHSVFQDIKLLDEKVRELLVQWDGSYWKYEDICAREGRHCFKTVVTSLGEYMRKFEDGNLTFKYPVDVIGGMSESLLPLGGLIMNEQNEILSAKSVVLSYYLDSSSKGKESVSSLWEETFSDLLERTRFKNIVVEFSISTSFSKELARYPSMLFPYAPASCILILSFTILTSLSPNWLRSKPWTGICTAIASGLATVSGFGLMSYCGVDFVSVDILVPFLVLAITDVIIANSTLMAISHLVSEYGESTAKGFTISRYLEPISSVGMDDTFVMLSVWKQTDPHQTIEERMGKMYCEAAISITVTSATNAIAFVVGWLLSIYLGLKSFCLYMATCLIFDYVYQITFVGACFALCARAEKEGKHSLFFFPLRKGSETSVKKFSSKLLCAIYPTDDVKNPTILSSALFDEFWKLVGKSLTWTTTKILVMCFYLAYLAIAIWGLTRITSTDTHKSIIVSNSSIDRFFDASFAHYPKNRESIQFVINTTVNYADEEVQRIILNMTQSFEDDEFLSGSDFTESWLKSYLKFINHPSFAILLNNFDMTQESTFIDILRRFFLRHPNTQRFKNDIVFNENYTKITSSRFFCQTNITKSYQDFRVQANRFKKLVSGAPYPIIMFHPIFPLFDGFNSLIPTAAKTLCTVAVTVIIVAWLLLPSVICTLCISYSVLSISVCTVGYMSLWGISLSLSTLVILIIASGLSVDCSAHMVCAYISQRNSTPNQKVSNAVASISMPIFQGSLTTVLGLLVLVVVPISAVVSAWKLIVLICFNGALHGIMILPIILFLVESVANVIKCEMPSKNLQRTCEKPSKNLPAKGGTDNKGLAIP